MPRLLDEDILTKEVLGWKGVHLMHMVSSSCSQKTRIFLNYKGVPWESHDIQQVPDGNWGEWFLGINPRGLVPVLIHDGAVYIESNDILFYIDQNFDGPSLIPAGTEPEIAVLLKQEDDLHFDLRALTIRYMFGVEAAIRNEDRLNAYRDRGSGTIEGKLDPHKLAQIEFWRTVRTDGISDDRVLLAANNFREVYAGFENKLEFQPYILGPEITLLDVAWYVYTNRLAILGYPFAKIHPNVEAWFQRLSGREGFVTECTTPPFLRSHIDILQAKHDAEGTSFTAVTGF